MIGTIKKSDFSQKTLKELKSGDSLLVVSSSFGEMEVACQIARNARTRLSIPMKIEQNKKTYTTQITIL